MFIHDTPAAFYGRGIKITPDTLEKWYLEFDSSEEEFQKYLLNQTFDNPVFACWSLRVKYRETSIKTIIAWLEKRDSTEVNSRWYDLIVELASRGSCEQDWCHTIYILDNNQCVIHRQSTALVSHGLTGLSNWPASISLGDYLMKRIDRLGNKRIIELGAGSGLLGLALLKSSDKILSYTFTDYSSMILNLLRQNVLLNFSEDDELNERVKVEELDWNQYSADESNRDCCDVILATDVVYDPSVIENLVKVLKILLENNKQSSAYVANAIRNESTYDRFRQALNQSSLNICSIETDNLQSIEILQLTALS
ncbi:unnamed protein product [Rotaria magnacalcarata]|uniref:Uncharacterized protein n=1 Tax=Rotaria magnacalcarata TaxID=392030 RepID=A0A819B2D5_9BILA|nr:unnamed protein product [Rotaria magnacalcarata]CAF1580023.1 unnamed protein product [Rotaria magnacalcarata]CAF2101429.1 unnamed protein product [Rotaria magnacalcarata]CAF2117297.1 unnamed protein product [Rotaria magnacalcarata]CAF3791512.1 unnamed protein product [Rotaria magnacalcarata]